MNVTFRSPDLDGDCVFADWVYVRLATPSGTDLVLRAPLHENGGCIFADPSQVQVLRQGGGSGKDEWVLLAREDEELIAVIIAATLRRGYGGFTGVNDGS